MWHSSPNMSCWHGDCSHPGKIQKARARQKPIGCLFFPKKIRASCQYLKLGPVHTEYAVVRSHPKAYYTWATTTTRPPQRAKYRVRQNYWIPRARSLQKHFDLCPCWRWEHELSVSSKCQQYGMSRLLMPLLKWNPNNSGLLVCKTETQCTKNCLVNPILPISPQVKHRLWDSKACQSP